MKMFNKKNLRRIITGILSFGLAFTAAYLLTNPTTVERTSNVSKKEPTHDIEEETYFDKFANKILEDLTLEEPIKFKATIENFVLSSKEDTNNAYCVVNGEFALSIISPSVFDFTLDVELSSRGHKLLLALGYVDNITYIALGDKGLKIPFTTLNEMISICKSLISSFSGPSIDINSLISGFDIASLIPEEIVTGNIVNFLINNEMADASITINKDSLKPLNITINKLDVDSISLEAAINITEIDRVVAFDESDYSKRLISFKEAKFLPKFISFFSYIVSKFSPRDNKQSWEIIIL